MNNLRRFEYLVATLLLTGAMSAHAAAPCDRACLEGFVDRYFDALLAHDPKLVPWHRCALHRRRSAACHR